MTGIAAVLVLLLSIAAAAIAQADDPPQEQTQPVPPEQVPALGTFWSLTLNQPPLPYLPWTGIDVYAQEDGSFVYDDRALVLDGAAVMMGAEGALLGGGQMMSMSGPPAPPGGGGGSGGGGGGISNPPPYSVAGLKLTIPVFTNIYIYTTIFEHNPALAYDIYAKTNLNSTNWVFASWGAVGQTNYYLLQSSYPWNVFLMAASNVDTDGDGIPDNWESAYGLNPYSAADASQDADGDGLTNWQEFQQGSNPASAPAFQVFISSPRNILP